MKVDEDLPSEVSELVRRAGYDVRTVFEQGQSGSPDDALWAHLQREGRLLMAADKGFANARDYPPGSHAGVVLFRLPRESRTGYVRLAEFLLAHLRLEDVVGAIVVVSADAIRIHRS